MLFVITVNASTSDPVLVLFPIEIASVDADFEPEFGSALEEGLQQRFKVFYGPSVEAELNKEFEKIDCDAERCVQNVALAFNGELVADASAKRLGTGYALKLRIHNVLTGELIESRTHACRNCDGFAVMDAFKAMGKGEVIELVQQAIDVVEVQKKETPPVKKKNFFGRLNGLVVDTVKGTANLVSDTVQNK
ncbi:MAG: hypothetical protein HRU20_24335 [Pseudomonadales bacterium]|nr:hypothetical protein [Pseudomonadales bacterium]